MWKPDRLFSGRTGFSGADLRYVQGASERLVSTIIYIEKEVTLNKRNFCLFVSA